MRLSDGRNVATRQADTKIKKTPGEASHSCLSPARSLSGWLARVNLASQEMEEDLVVALSVA